MKRYSYNNLTIEIIDEPTYSFGSADNNFNYSKHHFGDNAQEFPVSKHGIKITENDEIIESCIVIGSGGASGVYENSSLLDGEQLLLCCCDTIFCMKLPTLELIWKSQADQATCFGIYKVQDKYVVHGEVQITSLDKNGQIKWEFGGADIFVSLDNEDSFKLMSNYIELKDFYNKKYKINFDGKEIK
ncbi:hypothetical protein GM418_30575 [Maribellus comscasis]|uniref:Uncharacterized protein n=1 Tax=Maribellus comscasis TaxID=2681766 RepID=A0A6I6JXQ2_9BACT|nr:hypothetical protein [Maribellus comscasis]QGY47845.1 hypothetical protein GM418_30575 [Maribellus comscasis]